MDLDLNATGAESDIVALFSESQSRFVVTVAPDKVDAFEAAMSGSPVARLGDVITDATFKMKTIAGNTVEAPLSELKEAWIAPLNW
jgi:phosphoribosylformylglycinamidine synthase